MSGGEQQMLAIGRALMARPRLLMLDEPSMGIAPILVQRIYETIAEINRSGVAILLVEQNANYALEISSRGYVLETGRVALAKRLIRASRRPRSAEGVPGDMTVFAVNGQIGAVRAVPALYAWLLSAAIAAWVSDRKGYGERVGLTFGLLLTVVGLAIVLLLPARPGSALEGRGADPEAPRTPSRVCPRARRGGIHARSLRAPDLAGRLARRPRLPPSPGAVRRAEALTDAQRLSLRATVATVMS